MRISKGRSGSLSPADKTAQKERAKAFRRVHQVGDVVRGRLVRWAGEGLAWVHLDGQPLLANLPAETPLGAPLAFQVTALAPEIVLKRLAGQGAGAGGQGQLVAGFVAARAAFEAAWRARENGDEDAPAADAHQDNAADQRAAFLQAVGRDAAATRTFAQVQAAVAALNRLLPQDTRLVYPPWLAYGPAHGGADGPDSGLLSRIRDLEMVVTSSERESGAFTEAALSGVLDASPGSGPNFGPGAFQVRLMLLDDGHTRRAGVRVLAERPDFAPDVAQRLAQAVTGELAGTSGVGMGPKWGARSGPTAEAEPGTASGIGTTPVGTASGMGMVPGTRAASGTGAARSDGADKNQDAPADTPEARMPTANLDAVFHGIEPLPRHLHGGVLAELGRS